MHGILVLVLGDRMDLNFIHLIDSRKFQLEFEVFLDVTDCGS